MRVIPARTASSCAVRIKARLSDNVTMKIAGDYTRQRQNPPSGYLIDFVPTGPTVAKIARYNQFAAPYLNPQLGLPAGSVYDARWESEGPYRIYSLQPQQDDADIGGVAVTFDMDLSDDIYLKSISAWRKIDALIEVDGDQTPYPLQQSRTTHEAGTIEPGTSAGRHSDGRQAQLPDRRLCLPREGQLDRVHAIVRGHLRSDSSRRAAPQSRADVGNTFTTFALRATSFALFTQETLKLTDQFGVTVGARYNKDRKVYSHLGAAAAERRDGRAPIRPRSPNGTASPRASPWSTSRAATCCSMRAGRRASNPGGFGASTVASTPTPRYDPEKLTSYELGAKTSWFNNRLTFNVAGFYSEYRNIQLTVQSTDPVTNANIRTTRNAGGSDIKGFELEIAARPVRGLNLNLGVGYVDARFDDASDVGDRQRVQAGRSRAADPRLVDQRRRVLHGRDRRGPVHAARRRVAQGITVPDRRPTRPRSRTAIRWLARAFRGSRHSSPGIELSVEGTNLTETSYAYYKATLAPTGDYVAIPGAPREIYATVRFSF